MIHFEIVVKAAYDEVTVPDDMQTQLEGNVESCVARGGLLNDSEGEAIVDTWSATVEETTFGGRDSEIVRNALKKDSQINTSDLMDTATADDFMDILSQMWDGVNEPMAQLRRWGLSPEVEKWFWGDFEELLDNLKNKIPGG